MDLSCCLDAVAKRKKSHHCTCWDLNRGRPASSLITKLTDLLRLSNVLVIIKFYYPILNSFVTIILQYEYPVCNQ
jgi:hypothetical protein